MRYEWGLKESNFVANSFRGPGLLGLRCGLKALVVSDWASVTNSRNSKILEFWLSMLGVRLWEVRVRSEMFLFVAISVRDLTKMWCEWGLKCFYLWLTELRGWLKFGLSLVWNVCVVSNSTRGLTEMWSEWCLKHSNFWPYHLGVLVSEVWVRCEAVSSS